MKYLTTGGPKSCTPDWPPQIGYPNCDVPRGGSETLVIPKLFVYCSPPSSIKLPDVSGVIPNRRPQFRNHAPRPKGIHSYYNVMWDPRVRRGDPTQAAAKREQEECQKILNRLKEPRKSKSLKQKKQEKEEARRTLLFVDDEEQTKQEILRYSKLAISNLVPKDTENYLFDLADEIDEEDVCYKGVRLQTLRTFPVAPSRGVNHEDIATQIFPGDFFDFEEEAQPVLERLIGAVVCQARQELLEEEELAALILQGQLTAQKKQEELELIAMYKEREILIEIERQRLIKANRKTATELDATARLIEICEFAGSMSKDALDRCVTSLRKDGYLITDVRTLMELAFNPWLNAGVEHELKMTNIGRCLLDALMIDVVNNREAQYAETIWREVEEAKIRARYLRGDPVIPPTPGASLMGEASEDEAEVEDLPLTN